MLSLQEAEESFQEWEKYLRSNYPSNVITPDFDHINSQERS
jgi:hypothetical protein